MLQYYTEISCKKKIPSLLEIFLTRGKTSENGNVLSSCPSLVLWDKTEKVEKSPKKYSLHSLLQYISRMNHKNTSKYGI